MGQSILQKTKGIITSARDVKNLYDDLDLSNCELFAGGYTNFGFWKNLNYKGQITASVRCLSSRQLYIESLNQLKIDRQDVVLEVGCGLGSGLILIAEQFSPKYAIGVDASLEQLNRANQLYGSYLSTRKDSIKLAQMSAESLSFKDNTISKIVSVEAVQHFSDFKSFIDSMYRVLKKGGRVVISAFFFLREPPLGFNDHFPTFADGIDRVIMESEFRACLIERGFKNVSARSIGKHVWEGFDKWIRQTIYKDTWDRNWLIAFHQGILDYFIIDAEK